MFLLSVAGRTLAVVAFNEVEMVGLVTREPQHGGRQSSEQKHEAIIRRPLQQRPPRAWLAHYRRVHPGSQKAGVVENVDHGLCVDVERGYAVVQVIEQVTRQQDGQQNNEDNNTGSDERAGVQLVLSGWRGGYGS